MGTRALDTKPFEPEREAFLDRVFLAREFLLSQEDFHGHGPRNEAL